MGVVRTIFWIRLPAGATLGSSGCGAAWLARLLGVQDFARSFSPLILQVFQHTINQNLTVGKGANHAAKNDRGEGSIEVQKGPP